MGLAGTASSGYSSALIFVQTSMLFLMLLDILSFMAISSLGFHDPASGPLHMVARLFTTQWHLADGVSGGSNPAYCVHQVVYPGPGCVCSEEGAPSPNLDKGAVRLGFPALFSFLPPFLLFLRLLILGQSLNVPWGPIPALPYNLPG